MQISIYSILFAIFRPAADTVIPLNNASDEQGKQESFLIDLFRLIHYLKHFSDYL